jgi:hypothetical protein
LIAASAAFAQTAERPTLRIGDRWDFAVYYTAPATTPSRTWIITSVGATSISGTENGEPLRLTDELNIIDSPREAVSDHRALNFPLTVGKKWRYSMSWLFKPKNSRGTAAVEATIEAFEKIRVPAGEFDAFRIASREALGGTSPIGSQYAGETTRTYWYAPAARAIVKSVSHSPYLGPSTVELVALQLQP